MDRRFFFFAPVFFRFRPDKLFQIFPDSFMLPDFLLQFPVFLIQFIFFRRYLLILFPQLLIGGSFFPSVFSAFKFLTVAS